MLGHSTISSCSHSAGTLTRCWLFKEHFECWPWGERMLGSPAGNPSYATVLTGWSFLCLFLFPFWYNDSIRYRSYQAKNLLVQWTLEDYKTYLCLQIFQIWLLCSPRYTDRGKNQDNSWELCCLSCWQWINTYHSCNTKLLLMLPV